MNARRGFTLTELLITMTAGSALMVLAVGLVHQSMHLTSAARRGADEHRAMSRLASQFRADIRMADRVTLESDSQIRISIPEQGEVTYIAEAATCARTIADPSAGDRNAQAGRESYQLQPGGLMRFEMLEQPRRAALVLSRGGITAIHRPQESGPKSELHFSLPLEALRVEAAIGAVASFLSPQAQE